MHTQAYQVCCCWTEVELVVIITAHCCCALLLQVAVKVMPKQRGKLTKERTLQKLAKEVSR